METCTAKSVRKVLEAELQVDLDPLKDKINEFINLAIEERTASSTKPKSSNTNSVQQSKDKEFEEDMDEDVDDETLAKMLQAEENARSQRHRRTTAKVKGKRLQRKDGPKTKRAAPRNAFNQPYLLSEPLGRLVGATEMSRPQVVKHIWAYVKEHNLQDPSDKRILVCDELMLPVMRKPKISCFGMNKILSDHLIKPEDVVGSKATAKRSIDEVNSDDENFD